VARRIHKPADKDPRKAQTDLTSYLGSLISTTSNRTLLAEDEAIHSEASELAGRLIKDGLPYEAVLSEVRSYVESRPTPVLDVLRK